MLKKHRGGERHTLNITCFWKIKNKFFFCLKNKRPIRPKPYIATFNIIPPLQNNDH